MGSISANCATTKYNTDPLVATDRYFSRAIDIFSSVASVSIKRASIIADVSYTKQPRNIIDPYLCSLCWILPYSHSKFQSVLRHLKYYLRIGKAIVGFYLLSPEVEFCHYLFSLLTQFFVLLDLDVQVSPRRFKKLN